MARSKIRNIGIIAHIDAGKTTLSERILFYTGKNRKIGEVHTGQATMDFMDQEQERGITIYSAATTCFWKDTQLNLIDTPGHVDFTLEVERSLRILDGVIGVFCAVGGVQSQSETVFRQAAKFNIPKIAFINKMDRQGAHFHDVVSEIETKLAVKCCVLFIPWFKDEEFSGIIDVLSQKLLVFDGYTKGLNFEAIDVPADYQVAVSGAREELLLALANVDDMIGQHYVDDSLNKLDIDMIKNAIRTNTINNNIVPVICGSAFKNKGIQPLLDCIVDYLPSPADMPDITAYSCEDGSPVIVKAKTDSFFSALVFKIINDSYMGRMLYIRIYSGILRKGDIIYNATLGISHRATKILKVHASKREEVSSLCAGDIGSICGLNEACTGNTLLSSNMGFQFENISLPEAVIYIGIEPKFKVDDDKLGLVLNKLSAEDPSLTVKTNKETNQRLIGGMGELHLEILIERMKREYGLFIKSSLPKIAYKETITAKATAEGRYIKQTGGRGQYGHVILTVEPVESNSIEVIDRTVGGSIPKEYIKSVESGIRAAATEGFVMQFPMVGTKVSIIDGSCHEVDSSDRSFAIAGSIAFKEAVKKASPILLEPVMKLEVCVPEEFMGIVIRDINSKRGKIINIEDKNNAKIIISESPIANLFGYSTTLRSLTQGRGTFAMQFLSYSQVPAFIFNEMIDKYNVV